MYTYSTECKIIIRPISREPFNFSLQGCMYDNFKIIQASKKLCELNFGNNFRKSARFLKNYEHPGVLVVVC